MTHGHFGKDGIINEDGRAAAPPNAAGVTNVVRAKFRCLHVTLHEGGNAEVSLHAVTFKPGEDAENKSFWEATPCGQIAMTITRAQASMFFTPGCTYYVDFKAA